MSNELMTEALNEAWRELFPLPEIRKRRLTEFVSVKRTDEMSFSFTPKLPDLTWCKLPTKMLTTPAHSA